jgi:hypothetical protein
MNSHRASQCLSRSRHYSKSYIKSILCLQELPSLTPSDKAPGARSRYDDFVASVATLVAHGFLEVPDVVPVPCQEGSGVVDAGGLIAFSTKQKKSYIKSILCLQELPSLTPSDKAPGARSSKFQM